MPRVELFALLALGLAAAPLSAQRSRVITEDEIAESAPNATSAYDVVRTLRPRWLATRGITTLGGRGGAQVKEELHVYLNDHDMGDVEVLKTIPAETVASLRWMSMTEAGARLGPSVGPVIVVTLKR